MIGAKLGPYEIPVVICHCYRGFMKAQKQALYVYIIARSEILIRIQYPFFLLTTLRSFLPLK